MVIDHRPRTYSVEAFAALLHETQGVTDMRKIGILCI